ncbi:MAG: phosphoribosylglycinamide formyltransferase [Bacteroidia bacterium]|nr:phosphoribosylglycinamide formyltransferase [Bacteroidia bacterium]
MKEDKQIRLAIFASGGGSNAGKIVEHFKNHPNVIVSLFVTHNPASGVIEMGKACLCPVILISKKQVRSGEYLTNILKLHEIDLVVLAGYIKYIPTQLVQAFPNRILNIHPSLLPSYGGKGMYGMNVHRAVKASGDSKSGMSIHLVNEKYDEGELIFQAEVSLVDSWTAEEIQQAVLKLEHEHYPRVIEKVCDSLLQEKKLY